MHVLLVNDDGILADGLWALYKVFSRHATVTVVAPDSEKSAVGHAITLHQPLRARQVSVNGGRQAVAVSGTPADCVKLAMLEILEARPDLVVSGINPGANVGVNLHYSGTVAAAREACLYGVPALAVSVNAFSPGWYEDAALAAWRIAQAARRRGVAPGVFLNVNVPDLPLAKMAGVRVCRQAVDLYGEYFEKRRDPRNRPYYWQGCASLPAYASDEDDGAALCKGFVVVTPVRCDMTDYRALESMRSWPLDKELRSDGGQEQSGGADR